MLPFPKFRETSGNGGRHEGPRPSPADLETIAAGYKLPAATGPALDLQTDTVRDFGTSAP